MASASETDELLCLIRFDQSLAYAYRNSIKRCSSILRRSYLAKECAFNPEMMCVEGHDAHRVGMGLIYFPNYVSAEDWVATNAEVRQHDWLLNDVDIMFIPMRRDFSGALPVLEVACWDFIKDAAGFESNYLQQLDSDIGLGRRNIAAAPDRAIRNVRGMWSPKYITINRWPSLENYKSMQSEFQKDLDSFIVHIAKGRIYVGVNQDTA